MAETYTASISSVNINRPKSFTVNENADNVDINEYDHERHMNVGIITKMVCKLFDTIYENNYFFNELNEGKIKYLEIEPHTVYDIKVINSNDETITLFESEEKAPEYNIRTINDRVKTLTIQFKDIQIEDRRPSAQGKIAGVYSNRAGLQKKAQSI